VTCRAAGRPGPGVLTVHVADAHLEASWQGAAASPGVHLVADEGDQLPDLGTAQAELRLQGRVGLHRDGGVLLVVAIGDGGVPAAVGQRGCRPAVLRRVEGAG